jgi:dTDP-4-dehydrorhamnose 3,5-epimerase-like enzyme
MTPRENSVLWGLWGQPAILIAAFVLDQSFPRTTIGRMKSPKWSAIRAEARKHLEQRDYSAVPFHQKVQIHGVAANELLRLAPDDPICAELWIPGAELIPIKSHHQRNRGSFAELGRETEGALAKIGLWPKQWSTATMFAGTAKGFHVHPPFVPEKQTPEAWFKRLYLSKKAADRPYDREQWDVMYFLNGSIEILLVDERAGLPRRVWRLYIQGYNRPGPDNVALVIPPGVAHALRAEGREDLFMVYGSTTLFDPENEGRIASRIEQPLLPKDWKAYLTP